MSVGVTPTLCRVPASPQTFSYYTPYPIIGAKVSALLSNSNRCSSKGIATILQMCSLTHRSVVCEIGANPHLLGETPQESTGETLKDILFLLFL